MLFKKSPILHESDCEDGDVRLVGGGSDNEGTVMVCRESLWGLVAEDEWSQTDALVVCKQLGFPLEGIHVHISGGCITKSISKCNVTIAVKSNYTVTSDCSSHIHAEVQAVKNSQYGKPRKPVHLSNVLCRGNETEIFSCTYFEFTSLDEKKEMLKEVEVAGVSRQSRSQLENSTEIITPLILTSSNEMVNRTQNGTISDQPTNSAYDDEATSFASSAESDPFTHLDLYLLTPIYLILILIMIGLLLAIV